MPFWNLPKREPQKTLKIRENTGALERAIEGSRRCKTSVKGMVALKGDQGGIKGC